MKLINDALSSAGLFIPPLLKIVNEYAWQTYAEKVLQLTNLRMISKIGNDSFTPTCLLAAVYATYSLKRESIY
jgi:hypothetical protein